MKNIDAMGIFELMVRQIDCFSQHYQANIGYISSLNSELKKFLDINQKFNNLVEKENIFLFARYCNLVVDLWEGIENETVRDYFPILANALKFINNWLDSLSGGKKQAILHEGEVEFSDEAQSSFAKISKQIIKNYSINNWLILLRKLNENELNDPDLTQLLAIIDLEHSSIRVNPPDKLTCELGRISQASFDRFKSIQTTLKSSTLCSEEKRRMLERISAVFTYLLGQEDPELSSILSDLKQLSSDYDKFLSNENTIAQGVTDILKVVQTCVNQTDWNRKAKYIFGPPQGIRDIRKLLKAKKLSEFEKLVALHKLVSKKCLTTSRRRNMLTRVFYETVATSLQAIYDNLDSANKELWESDKLLRFTWITEEQVGQLTEIFKKLENATSEITLDLQRPYNVVYAEVRGILTGGNSDTAETVQLERFRKKLQTFKQGLFSPEWNNKGIGFAYLYKKFPQGINDLRKLYNDKKLEFLAGEEKMTPTQLIYLIKAILQTYAILQQRLILPTSLRDTAVRRFYVSNYAYFRASCVDHIELLDGNSSQQLSEGLRTLFDFISACEAESTPSILASLGLPTLNSALCRAALFATSNDEASSNDDATIVSNTNTKISV